jgi:hypothetical protein
LITQPSGKGYCPFPVQIDQSNGQTTTTSTGPHGETIYKITGNAVATVTNLKTGKQLTYKISDPGTVVVNPDGSFSSDVEVEHGPPADDRSQRGRIGSGRSHNSTELSVLAVAMVCPSAASAIPYTALV